MGANSYQDIFLCIAAFISMAGIGSAYGLSALQIELVRSIAIRPSLALLPFGGTSLGLAFGCGSAPSILLTRGPRFTATLGSILWGTAVFVAGLQLQRNSFWAVVLAYAVGGFGVGLTYLTILATIGKRFPQRPLIGSVIGPAGFGTGTASLLLFASSKPFQAATRAELGRSTGICGVLIVLIAVMLSPAFPSHTQATKSMVGSSKITSTARKTLSHILLGNAFPGMTLLGIVVPYLHRCNVDADISRLEVKIAAMTVTLVAGGLFAPFIASALGPRRGLVLALVLRALALVNVAASPKPTAALIALGAVLFGHGLGFGIMPALTRKQDHPPHFVRNYGQILVYWGASGVAGCAVNILSLELGMEYTFSTVASILAAIATSLTVLRSPPSLV